MMAKTYYRMQANSRGIDSWLVTWEARPKKPGVFRTTHFLDEARVYTEQEILESSYPLHDGEHWVLVECSAAESVTVRVVEPGWWLRHMGPVPAEPSKDQRDARARLGELDPGVKVKAVRLTESLPDRFGKPIEWVATSEPLGVACGGSTEAEALESFRRVAVERVATSVARGELELTEAEWAMFRRLLACALEIEITERAARAVGQVFDEELQALQMLLTSAKSPSELAARQAACRHINRPAYYCSCPDCGAAPAQCGYQGCPTSVPQTGDFCREHSQPHGEGCLCPEPCPYTQTPRSP